MYMEVDRKCIEEGIALVSKLNITNTDEKVNDDAYLKANKEKLNTFCLAAEKTMKTVMKKVRIGDSISQSCLIRTRVLIVIPRPLEGSKMKLHPAYRSVSATSVASSSSFPLRHVSTVVQIDRRYQHRDRHHPDFHRERSRGADDISTGLAKRPRKRTQY
jgi:hypothetical protein